MFMEIALPTALAALALVTVFWRLRRHRKRVPIQPRVAGDEHVTIVLDVGEVPSESESLRRLVREAGERALAESRDISEVDVRGRDGTLLGHMTKTAQPMPPFGTPPQGMRPRAARRNP